MSDEIEAKLDVINRMNAALGKVTNVQIRLTLAGEDELAQELDRKRRDLIQQIEFLQGQVADKWTVEAAELTEKLRVANTKVQDRIRNIKNKVSIANNAIQIIGQVDDALTFLQTIVKPR